MLNIFVYGTLKRGFPLHSLGLKPTQFRFHARTVEPYPLYIAGDFYGPMMLDEPGKGLRVTGELYTITQQDLPRLDELEDVGRPGSFRADMLVEAVDGGDPIATIGFMKDRSWLDPLHTGYLSDYQDRRFVPPWARDRGKQTA